MEKSVVPEGEAVFFCTFLSHRRMLYELSSLLFFKSIRWSSCLCNWSRVDCRSCAECLLGKGEDWAMKQCCHFASFFSVQKFTGTWKHRIWGSRIVGSSKKTRDWHGSARFFVEKWGSSRRIHVLMQEDRILQEGDEAFLRQFMRRYSCMVSSLLLGSTKCIDAIFLGARTLIACLPSSLWVFWHRFKETSARLYFIELQ